MDWCSDVSCLEYEREIYEYLREAEVPPGPSIFENVTDPAIPEAGRKKTRHPFIPLIVSVDVSMSLKIFLFLFFFVFCICCPIVNATIFIYGNE